MHSPITIITGAGSGIGRATAIELARRGHRCVLVGRRREPLEQTAALLRGPGSLVHLADVSQPQSAGEIVAAAASRFGQVDALVNNAGFAPRRSIEQVTVDEWRAILDINLSAAFYLTQAVWPIFRRGGGGVVVNVSSLASRDPFPGLGAYGTAKAGLNLLGLALAREGEPLGIRVHTLVLGAVETPMLRELFSTEQLPTQATLKPMEVADAIAGCISGELRYSSGELIPLHRGPA